MSVDPWTAAGEVLLPVMGFCSTWFAPVLLGAIVLPAKVPVFALLKERCCNPPTPAFASGTVLLPVIEFC
jgi:hypothetical protein